MTFSIAHASARPHGWRRTFLEAMKHAADPNAVEYVLSVDERFGQFIMIGLAPEKVLRLAPTERKCAVSNWVNAINGTTGDVIIVNSDDFSFPLLWDEKLFSEIGGRDPQKDPFVIQVSTGGQRDDTLMTIQIFSRALINHWGYGLWPEYDGMYVDDDFSEHAFSDPDVEVIQARQIMFEHLHFSFGKSEVDEVYSHENRSEGGRIGQEIIARRRLTNFK